MTEKRFTLEDDLDILDNTTGRIIPPCLDRGLKELVDLLNNLHETNEQLQHDATILIQANQDYMKENEQLQQFKYKVYRVIRERIDLLESDYNQAVKAGMPSNSVYGEIELLEDLKKELGE